MEKLYICTYCEKNTYRRETSQMYWIWKTVHTEEQPYHSSARKYGAAGIGLLYAVSVTIVLEIPKN